MFHISNILQNTHAPIRHEIYDVDTGGSIMKRYKKWITYWHITQWHVSKVQGQMSKLTEYPKYARDAEIQSYTKYALENWMGICLLWKIF